MTANELLITKIKRKHSWMFYQSKTFIDYKAKLLGIPVAYIDPRNTSKTCSRCGRIDYRKDKKFECLYPEDCGYVDHADVNTSFNIALRMHASVNLVQTEMYQRGSLITPNSNAVNESATIEPTMLYGWIMSGILEWSYWGCCIFQLSSLFLL